VSQDYLANAVGVFPILVFRKFELLGAVLRRHRRSQGKQVWWTIQRLACAANRHPNSVGQEQADAALDAQGLSVTTEHQKSKQVSTNRRN